jgi:pimeloyl-ACP methyl ester carboxylesterase
MPFADMGQRRIYYEIHGSGPTVVLLHHGFAGTRMWKGIYPSLIEAGYRVLMYDRRGYGLSEPGADFREFYLSRSFCEESAADLEELSQLLALEAFHIVGQCEGGVIGVEYAGLFPHRVSSMVISSTLCFSTSTMTEFNALKFPKPFDVLEPDIRHKLLDWHGQDHAPVLYEMARTHGGAYGIGAFDLRPRLSLVQCPALVLYPDRSALFEVEQSVAMYRRLSRGELAVLPRCGHNTYDHQPDEYVRHVLTFLNRTSSGEGTVQPDFSMTCLAPSPTRSP